MAGPLLSGQACDLTLERHPVPIRSILKMTGFIASSTARAAAPGVGA
jgi:hypothetical protein